MSVVDNLVWRDFVSLYNVTLSIYLHLCIYLCCSKLRTARPCLSAPCNCLSKYLAMMYLCRSQFSIVRLFLLAPCNCLSMYFATKHVCCTQVSQDYVSLYHATVCQLLCNCVSLLYTKSRDCLFVQYLQLLSMYFGTIRIHISLEC
jgi:hypothetical protein